MINQTLNTNDDIKTQFVIFVLKDLNIIQARTNSCIVSLLFMHIDGLLLLSSSQQNKSFMWLSFVSGPI